jgi:RNA polymerase sigma factor (sigma-70 family)
MAAAHPDTVLQQVRNLVGAPGPELSDGQLLELFAARREQAAFAALVRRHGPLVLGTCRRVLHDAHDAEDAFQATFLVLARKAGSLDRRGSVAGWLYTVAQRIALKTRAGRRPPPPLLRASPPADPLDLLTGKELCALLDEELRRLPEKYRLPLLLCCLEGLSRDEAAQQLGWSLGALKGRLERGRELLRSRLIHRGVTLSAALLTAALVPRGATAVPAPLAAATLRAAVAFAARDTTASGVAAAPVTALAEGVLHAMSLNRLTTTAALLLGMGFLATGAGVLAYRALAANPPPAARPAPAAPGPDRPRTDRHGDPLPPGAVARLGTVRFRQDGWGLEGLAFVGDGKTLLTATSQGHALRLWDARTGRLLRTIASETLSVRGFGISPDGKLVAVGGFLPQKPDGTLPGATRVLDVATGKEVRTFPRADRDTDHCSLAFTPDDQLLLSLGDSGILRVEEIATGAELLRQQFPRDILPELAVSPDGKTLAVASGPNTRKLYLWDWQAGAEPRQLPVGDFVARWVAFSPDGKTLAATSDRDGVVHLWDVAGGRRRHRLVLPRGAVSYTGGPPVFTPDGKTLAVLGTVYARHDEYSSVYLWDPETGRSRGRLEPAGGRVAVSPDSRLLAAGGTGGVRVWDLATDKTLLPEAEAHEASISRVAVSARGVVATASDDGTVRLWDLATGAPRFRLGNSNPYQMIRAVAFSPDGGKLVTSGLDDTVRLWDADSGWEIYRLPGHGRYGGYRALGFTPDGKRFLSWGDDFYLRVWDVATGKALSEHRLHPTGVQVPGEKDDARDREMRMMMIRGPGVFSPDGKRLVLALYTGTYLFDAETGKQLHTIETGLRNVDAQAISPDSKWLLAGGWGAPIETRLPDGRTRHSTADVHPLGLWDLNSGKVVRQVLLPGSMSGPVAFSADGKTYAAATDRRVQIWDAATGKELPGVSNLPARATALVFSRDGRRLVTALEDTTALVWVLDRR